MMKQPDLIRFRPVFLCRFCNHLYRCRGVIPWRLLTGACANLIPFVPFSNVAKGCCDLAHRLFDHGRFQLTFPDHDHVPAGIPQNAVILLVSGFVGYVPKRNELAIRFCAGWGSVAENATVGSSWLRSVTDCTAG